MSNLNGRKVKTLRLHQTSQAEGFGTVTSPLVASDTTTKNLEMTVIDEGVLCKGTGKQGSYEFAIPSSNIICMDLTKEKTK